MSTIGNYTIPELNTDQHQILLTAVTVGENAYRDQIIEDPVFEELRETEDIEPEALLNRLLANLELPQETSEGSDTGEIRKLLWQIRAVVDLRKLLEDLQPHCARCGKITTDLARTFILAPAICYSCWEAVVKEVMQLRNQNLANFSDRDRLF